MADSNTGGKRKRSKAFYVGQKKKKKGQELLTPGMKGVIVTCNEREKLCIKEAYNVLNEYADQLYGPEHSSQGDKNASDSDNDDDIEEALAKEVKALQDSGQEKRFQAVLSGANNVIFIKTNLPESKDPTELVHSILTDMLKTGCKKTRHCQRFLPVADSCHANNEEIKKLATEMFQSTFFAEDAKPSKFCVIYRCRNNSSIHRDDTIAMLAGIVLNEGKGHTVDLNNPDLAICVEVIKNVCCMSVVRDLVKLRKYNIHEVNEQIHHLQQSSGSGNVKTKGENLKRESNNDNEDLHEIKENETHSDKTEVDQAGAENDDSIFKTQEKSTGSLNETAGLCDPSSCGACETNQIENASEL